MSLRRSLLATALLTCASMAGAGEAGVISIGQVQGTGAASPLTGQTVTVEGMVTADFRQGLGGFFLQDAGDGHRGAGQQGGGEQGAAQGLSLIHI